MLTSKFTRLLNHFKRRIFSNIWIARIVIILLLIIFIYLTVKITQPYYGIISAIFTPLEYQLPNNQGRLNLVLLGVGGPGHEAPDLTDTIIFVSTKLSTGETTVISIPRDMWVSSMRAKINTSYHYGEQKQVGGGIILTKSSITEVLGQPVHYAAILNFSTFVGVIDRLGGIDVNVENSFIDNKYPIAGRENDDCGGDDPEYLCRFETISFNAGLQHMDGTTALKYVRSRHSESQTEGTDFARSKRQTQVLKGVKSKFIEMSKDPKKYKLLLSVFEVVKSEIITDFPSNKIVASLLLANKIRSHELKTYSLSEPIIYHPPLSPLQDNQWVLLPKNNDPQVVYDHIRGLLN